MTDKELVDDEIQAMADVHASLAKLDEAGQRRVLEYVASRFGLTLPSRATGLQHGSPPMVPTQEGVLPKTGDTHAEYENDIDDSALEGISPVAVKWMRRNKLSADQLSKIFSLGLDEIDLVAQSVPGKNKRARSREVLLLLGIAKYLSGGAARFTHEEAKEACIHYDAYDQSNFAAGVKTFSNEVSGSASEGYELNARGISAATNLIKEITGGE